MVELVEKQGGLLVNRPRAIAAGEILSFRLPEAGTLPAAPVHRLSKDTFSNSYFQDMPRSIRCKQVIPRTWILQSR